ncbi:MAG: hypothetical protein ACXV5L_09590, partial [Thermoanaerobaculia bacterium]
MKLRILLPLVLLCSHPLLAQRPSPPPQPAPPSSEPESSPRARAMEQEQQRPATREPERERMEAQQPQERGGSGGATNTAFHFDMKESAPSVTHHSVTVNGRALR